MEDDRAHPQGKVGFVLARGGGGGEGKGRGAVHKISPFFSSGSRCSVVGAACREVVSCLSAAPRPRCESLSGRR